MAKIPDLAAIRDWCKSKFQPVGSYAAQGDIPTKTSQLQNDSGYKTTDTTYSDATQSVSGLMSAADKEKLDGIAANANKTTYTNNLTATVAGTALDAVQGKTLDDKGSQLSVYVGSDGKLHFRDWTGADTVIPFSSSKSVPVSFYMKSTADKMLVTLKVGNTTLLNNSESGLYPNVIWVNKSWNVTV